MRVIYGGGSPEIIVLECVDISTLQVRCQVAMAEAVSGHAGDAPESLSIHEVVTSLESEVVPIPETEAIYVRPASPPQTRDASNDTEVSPRFELR